MMNATGRKGHRSSEGIRIPQLAGLGRASMLIAVALLSACTALGAEGGLAVGDKGIIAESTAVNVLEIADISAGDARLKATLVNNSGNTLRDIQLVVRHAFLWKNERHPGKNNPGRTEYFLVLGEIPPYGRLPFVYDPDPSLPERNDGRFQTSVEVAGFTEVGAD